MRFTSGPEKDAPLTCALKNKYHGIVKILLATPSVDVNVQGNECICIIFICISHTSLYTRIDFSSTHEVLNDVVLESQMHRIGFLIFCL